MKIRQFVAASCLAAAAVEAFKVPDNLGDFDSAQGSCGGSPQAMKLGNLVGKCIKNNGRASRPSRPSRRDKARTCKLNPVSCKTGNGVRPSAKIVRMFKTSDFGWQMEQWVRSAFDLMKPNWFVTEDGDRAVQDAFDQRYEDEWATSNVQKVSKAFDKVGPALQVSYLKTKNLAMDSSTMIKSLYSDFQMFVFKSKEAILHIFWGSWLVFQEYQHAMNHLNAMDDSYTKKDYLQAFELSFKSLARAVPHIEAMKEGCDSQTSLAEQLIVDNNDAIDQVHSEELDSRKSDRNTNSELNTLREEEKQLRKLTKLTQDQFKQNKADLAENEAEIEKERVNVQTIIDKISADIAALPVGEKCAASKGKKRRSIFQKIGCFFAGCQDPPPPKCTNEVNQDKLKELQKNRELALQPIMNAIKAREAQRKAINQQKIKLQQLQHKHGENAMKLAVKIATADGEVERLAIAITTLEFVQGQLVKVRQQFEILQEYFNAWANRFKVLVNDCRRNMEGIDNIKSEKYDVTRGPGQNLYSSTHEDIYNGALDWAVQVRLAYNATQEIAIIKQDLTEVEREFDIQKVLKMFQDKTVTFLAQTEQEMLDQIETNAAEDEAAEEMGLTEEVKSKRASMRLQKRLAKLA